MGKIRLDKYQMEAVKGEQKNLVVIAPPGSGKTFVIINRIFYLMKERGVCGKNIFAMTFTKSAAKDMERRFLDLQEIHQCNFMYTPFFGTLHSLFYNILKVYVGVINIISEKESAYIIEKTLKKYTNNIREELIKDILNNISKYKSKHEIDEHIDRQLFYECYDEYEKYKQGKGKLDFDDIQIKCKELLENNKKILSQCRDKFKYLLIDEFQDCDDIQLSILNMLNKDNSIFAVGDEDQCIYNFRGAKPEAMVEFPMYFNQGKKIFLKINYRSGKNIVKLSKNLIKINKLRNSKEIFAYNEFDGEIKIIYSEDEKEQIKNILKEVLYNTEKKGYNFKDVAILYRRNLEALMIIDYFLRNNVEFNLNQKYFNIYNHFICNDIISYIKLSLDNRDRYSLIRIINKPFRYISKIHIEKLREFKEKDSCFDIMCNFNMSIVQIKTIKSLEKKINRIKNLNNNKVIDYIMKDIGYEEYIKSYSKKFKIDEEELLYIIYILKKTIEDFTSLEDFIKYIEKSKNKFLEKKENAITLSSIHSSKGMEFKSVFIINCNDGNIPYNSNVNNLKDNIKLEEERRLFYVAITRSISNLNLCICSNIGGKYLPYSRFLKECNLDLKDSYQIGEVVLHKYLGEGKIEKIKENKITIDFNGICRMLKLDVININGLIQKRRQNS
ncbi:ATP-dependent helicase [Clostridium cochlearium]|uniref:ATP-dependent helicase n=1 Tax=Clostridium cochlearium TaxID=1494 RepID=UPI001EE0C0DE|nr:ATP-dependent helicase [Clostridium cochlearium]MCG4580149.1 ATP-dependent helicase [Clostridium cochlearium]